jgi:hypothetical protein
LNKSFQLRLRDGANLEVERRGRKVDQQLKELLVCQRSQPRRDGQAPPIAQALSEFLSALMASLSTSAAWKKEALVFVLPLLLSFSGLAMSNFVVVPGRVGKKKGARSGAFGASTGLFRASKIH